MHLRLARCRPVLACLALATAVPARVPLSGSIRTTPALACGRVYVTTDAG